jgi:hypothetical protein
LLGIRFTPTTTAIRTWTRRALDWENRGNTPRSRQEEQRDFLIRSGMLNAKDQAKRDMIKGYYNYSSNIAGPKAAEDEENGNKAKKLTVICPFCDKKGHKTMVAKHFIFSLKVGRSPHYREDSKKELSTGKSYVQSVLLLLSK